MILSAPWHPAVRTDALVVRQALRCPDNHVLRVETVRCIAIKRDNGQLPYRSQPNVHVTLCGLILVVPWLPLELHAFTHDKYNAALAGFIPRPRKYEPPEIPPASQVGTFRKIHPGFEEMRVSNPRASMGSLKYHWGLRRIIARTHRVSSGCLGPGNEFGGARSRARARMGECGKWSQIPPINLTLSSRLTHLKSCTPLSVTNRGNKTICIIYTNYTAVAHI